MNPKRHIPMRANGEGFAPSLSDLIQRHALTVRALESVCGRNMVDDIFAATRGQKVDRMSGDAILRGINTIAETGYVMEDIAPESFKDREAQ